LSIYSTGRKKLGKGEETEGNKGNKFKIIWNKCKIQLGGRDSVGNGTANSYLGGRGGGDAAKDESIIHHDGLEATWDTEGKRKTLNTSKIRKCFLAKVKSVLFEPFSKEKNLQNGKNIVRRGGKKRYY